MIPWICVQFHAAPLVYWKEKIFGFGDLVGLLASRVSPNALYVNESPFRWIGQA